MKKLFFILFLFSSIFSRINAQWQRIETFSPQTYYGGTIDALGDNFAIFTLTQSKLLITTDAGKTWTTKNLPQTEYTNDISLVNENIFYISTSSGKFYKTTDGGNSWVSFFSDPHLCSSGNYIEMFNTTTGVAVGDGPASSLKNSLILKTKTGTDWQQVCFQPIGYSGDRWCRLDFVDENNGYFYASGISPEKLLKTTDGGSSWTSTNFNGRAYSVKFYNKDYGFVYNDSLVNPGSIYRTTNGGSSWQRYSVEGMKRASDIEFVPGNPSNIWIGCANGSYFSADSGKTWTQKIFADRIDDIIFPTSKTGWALSPTGNLYYTNNNGGSITGVTNRADMPIEFRLFQNFPNPFNPATNISYQLATECLVSLKVYNALGKEVASLVNGFRRAGIYNSEFSISNRNLASGVYYYHFRAGSYSETKKMVLLK